VSLSAPKHLAVSEVVRATALVLPRAAQCVSVEERVLGPPLPLRGAEAGDRGLGLLVGPQGGGHPAVVRVSQDQTLLGAHLRGLHQPTRT